LFDKPTNFLSLAGIQWLADLLEMDKKLTILMVTHNRAFWDEAFELDKGTVQGSYTNFLEAKEERLVLQDQALQATKNKYKQELIDAFCKLEKATKPRPLDANLILNASDQQPIGTKI
jgi:ATP-binding cassette subfamily F protein uup